MESPMTQKGGLRKIEKNPKLMSGLVARQLQDSQKMLRESGLETLKGVPQEIRSARHYFATNAIVEWGWDYKTAAHMGNSAQIEIDTPNTLPTCLPPNGQMSTQHKLDRRMSTASIQMVHSITKT